jgi:hypothetical protein
VTDNGNGKTTGRGSNSGSQTDASDEASSSSEEMSDEMDSEDEENKGKNGKTTPKNGTCNASFMKNRSVLAKGQSHLVFNSPLKPSLVLTPVPARIAGPEKVLVPKMDEEYINSFFESPTRRITETIESVDVNLNAIEKSETELLGMKKKVTMQKRRQPTGNPLKKLASRSDFLQDFYTETSLGVSRSQGTAAANGRTMTTSMTSSSSTSSSSTSSSLQTRTQTVVQTQVQAQTQVQVQTQTQTQAQNKVQQLSKSSTLPVSALAGLLGDKEQMKAARGQLRRPMNKKLLDK